MADLDATKEQKVVYCIADWQKNEQIKSALRRAGIGRIQPGEKRSDPIAIVGFGPSLNDTWQQIKNFKYVMTCSGAHKFLVEHGVVPTHHCDVDPRPHKAKLIGIPQQGTHYLMASCCHPDVFDLLAKHNAKVSLWHVWDSTEEGFRTLPNGEFAITGGCSAGLRALAVAGFLGFREFHIFGFDGNYRDGKSHGAEHPSAAKPKDRTEYPVGSGKWWSTTAAFLEAARQTWHELDLMPTVKATFYGDGLVQEMAKNYVPKHGTAVSQQQWGLAKPVLISEEYRRLNEELHDKNAAYGAGGDHYAPLVLDLAKRMGTTSILDYGAGKGRLQATLPFPIFQYDPCVPGKTETPRAADIVVATDVLEHVEPDKLDYVLAHIRSCMRKVGYFTINTGPAVKKLSDGRNTHQIQKPEKWWTKKLSRFFTIGRVYQHILVDKKKRKTGNYELHYVVGVKKPPIRNRRWHVLEDLVKKHKWTRGVEVGVKEGKTFLHLLKDCPSLQLTGVDLFEARVGLETEGGESFAEVDWPRVWSELNTAAAQYGDRAKLLKTNSTAAAAQFADGSLDFCFLDADHREAAVRADIAAWLPKIRPGGWLLGHDAQKKFPGVLAAINDLCPGWIAHPDSVWAWPVEDMPKTGLIETAHEPRVLAAM